MPLPLSLPLPEDQQQGEAPASARMPKKLRPGSKKAAMDTRLAAVKQEEVRRMVERGRLWYRQQYRLRRQQECEREVDDQGIPAAPLPAGFRTDHWDSASTERQRRAQMEEERRRWAPLSEAQSHHIEAFSRMTEALEPGVIEALRKDLCYLCSMHGRDLPSHMKVEDPPDDDHWDVLLGAHVMVREEEEPKVGGGCWLWSILEPRVHIPRVPPRAHGPRAHPPPRLPRPIF